MYDFSEFGRGLLNLGKHPQAEAYFEIAYRAIMDGDNNRYTHWMVKNLRMKTMLTAKEQS
jgi:hypothetical protein